MASQVSAGVAAATTAPTAETAIASVSPGSINPASTPILVAATVPLIGATSVTAMTLRVRRGAGTGGAVVATEAVTVTGAQTLSGALEVVDTAYDGSGYTLTVQATGAAGTCGPGSLSATPQQTGF